MAAILEIFSKLGTIISTTANIDDDVAQKNIEFVIQNKENG